MNQKINLKQKHFEISRCISYFVDRNYFPNFVEPTREQIEIFFHIESHGKKQLTPAHLELVKPLLNGKVQYELQIKNVYEEFADWYMHGWGWYSPYRDIIVKCYNDRHHLKPYIKFLRKLKRRFKKEGCLPVLCSFSEFDDSFREKLRSRSLQSF